MDYVFLLSIIFINLIFLLNYNSISKLYGLYDHPTEERKKQSFPVPLLGGIYFLVNFILYCIYEVNYGENNFFYNLGFNNNINIFVFIFSTLSIFLLGFIDDKINLKPLTKIILLIFLLYILFISNEKINLNALNILIFNRNIDLYQIGLPFSILCVLIFINALNMMDGVDGISIIFFSSVFCVFTIFKFQQTFSIMMLIALFFFAFLNFKGKAYLGDSGVYLLSFITAIFIISFYETNNLYVENILLMIFLPTIDFFRLVAIRIYKNKSPFLGDRNHFHHFLEAKMNKLKSTIVLIIFIYAPILLTLLLKINPLIVLFIMIVFYFVFLNFLKKEN